MEEFVVNKKEKTNQHGLQQIGSDGKGEINSNNFVVLHHEIVIEILSRLPVKSSFGKQQEAYHEVFTLGSIDEDWRSVANPPVPIHCRGCCVDGALHWTVDAQHSKDFVLTFSFQEEKFGFLPFPESPNWKWKREKYFPITKNSESIVVRNFTGKRLPYKYLKDSLSKVWGRRVTLR
ncbi:hypothetical protein GIB67_003512 [Kingdonia uniflora]|uniref:F-box associated beta-propeller type 3 domain-containing protein n=1 Tax=Kingdonia uniflora TaxID=39325 RepID=A0A7J7MEU0_9MAGN|nr:hypothetical protein GIB67_003512 [Kingdonia uniflora]